ncbi:hypothetical protein PUN28_014256 [Cardiocondyla obscurior]|uniref:Uncharacterized protein n=1 Tax=Cardiocondyla obscurior TaxID=286306 RepID=A0AAW2F346_9HYME
MINTNRNNVIWVGKEKDRWEEEKEKKVESMGEVKGAADEIDDDKDDNDNDDDAAADDADVEHKMLTFDLLKRVVGGWDKDEVRSGKTSLKSRSKRKQGERRNRVLSGEREASRELARGWKEKNVTFESSLSEIKINTTSDAS